MVKRMTFNHSHKGSSPLGLKKKKQTKTKKKQKKRKTSKNILKRELTEWFKVISLKLI